MTLCTLILAILTRPTPERTSVAQPPHQSKVFEENRGGASRSGSLEEEGGNVGALSPSTESFPFPLQIFFPLLRLHRPGAENVGPDADEGRAFLDGLHAVAGHAHRKLGQLDAEAGFEIVAQLAEPG